MSTTPEPMAEDYKLAENIKRRREAYPDAYPTSAELAAINRILVQQARERLARDKHGRP